MALGPWSLLLASFIDSVGIPMTVGLDALVIFFAVKEPGLTLLWVGLAVAGSSAGNLVLFHASRTGGARLLKTEAPESRQRRFREWFNRYGLVTVFIPAFIPIPLPLKFFVVCSGMLGIRWTHFTGVILLARLLRYGGEAYLGMQMGEHSAKYLSDHARALLGIAALLALALFLLVRLNDRRASRPRFPV